MCAVKQAVGTGCQKTQNEAKKLRLGHWHRQQARKRRLQNARPVWRRPIRVLRRVFGHDRLYSAHKIAPGYALMIFGQIGFDGLQMRIPVDVEGRIRRN